tara:strand:- start:101 stop:313 length:213 start_codon:yes stop_codon:yes gene_type:complete
MKMPRSNHWYVPGKTPAEKQHLHEHNTLQVLQRLALNKKWEEFDKLLETISDKDKQHDIKEICHYENSKN